jgi:hypothetical protein
VIGESLSFLDIVCFNCDQGTSLANPCFTCSIVSSMSACATAGSLADSCAPRVIASLRRVRGQSAPQFAGQPVVAYVWRSRASGWRRAGPDGDIRLRWGNLIFWWCGGG